MTFVATILNLYPEMFFRSTQASLSSDPAGQAFSKGLQEHVFWLSVGASIVGGFILLFAAWVTWFLAGAVQRVIKNQRAAILASGLAPFVIIVGALTANSLIWNNGEFGWIMDRSGGVTPIRMIYFILLASVGFYVARFRVSKLREADDTTQWSTLDEFR